MSAFTEVVKKYDWRGRHVGYQADSMSIPLAPGNRHFEEIQEGISAGTCIEIEPEITSATKVLGENGQLTGYDTNLGFLQANQSNALFQLLKRREAAEAFVVSEPELSFIPEGEKKETLIIAVLFNRPWDHLSGPFEREFPYKSSEKSDSIDLLVRLRNLPSPATSGAVDLLFNSYGISWPLGARQLPLQVGALEIEIPVSRLLRLFRSERKFLGDYASFLDEFVAEHLARTGRSRRRGPSQLWLISNAYLYLGRLAASLGNVVSRTFVAEWGGTPPGYIRADVMFRHGIIIGRCVNGTAVWQGGGPQATHSFNLTGEWPDHGAAIQEVLAPDIHPLGHRRHVPRRVDQLLAAGFAMEALSLLNSFLEVAVRDTLINAVLTDANAVANISRASHRMRLDKIKRLAKQQFLSQRQRESLTETIGLAEEIYTRRNNYLHDLSLPSGERWLSYEAEARITELISAFTDPSTGGRRFNALIYLGANSKTFLVDTSK